MPSESASSASRRIRSAATLLGSLALGACSVVGVRSGTPQPHYTVLETLGQGPGAIEIRRYDARLAAETIEAGDEIAARYTGFRRLAGFIFGGNRSDTRIAMTAPVSQSSAPAATPSGPVSSTPAADGRWRIRFFLPDTMRAGDVPAPNDPSIRIVSVPAETMAVSRFSGTPDPGAVAEHGRSLLAGLHGTRWQPSGQVVAWFYDPPWTLPPLRRNEVAVPVSARP